MTSSSRSSALNLLAASAALAALLSGCGDSDGSSEYAKAEEALKSGNLAKAGELFAQTAEIAPTNIDALVMLAKTRLANGEIREAREAAKSALALDGDAEDALELAAQTAWHSRDYAEARGIYRRLASDAGRAPEARSRAWARLGIVDMSEYDTDKSRVALRDSARCDFLAALALDPKNAAARYHLGLLYRDSYLYLDYALDQLSFYKATAPKVDRHLKAVCDTMIPELRGQIANEKAARPGVAKRNVDGCAKALRRGVEAFSKGTYKTAKLRYGEAMSADPLSFAAAEGYARSCAKADTTAAGKKTAYEAYREACRLGPSKVDTFLETARLAAEIGRSAAAEDLYSRALAANPKSLPALDGLIRTCVKNGEKESAAAYRAYMAFIQKKAAQR